LTEIGFAIHHYIFFTMILLLDSVQLWSVGKSTFVHDVYL